MVGLDEVKRRLRVFAADQAAGVSPLYEHLAERAAEDDDVAGLLTAAPDDQAQPALLLATAMPAAGSSTSRPRSREA